MNVEKIWDNYKGIMWIMALYDIPTTKKEYRQEYTRLRKFLLSLGFTMEQYSVYVKHCPGMPHVFKIKKKIKKFKLKYGTLMLIVLTDKQYGMIENIYGTEPPPKPKKDKKQNLPNLFSFLSENQEKLNENEKKKKSNKEKSDENEEDEDE